ncbi:uncharacterized protein LOC132614801 [Lycium barbarum]|uniref:uncharacterized protein LOC132614801 n=1 Tax=Lycium barbarum TaxID=112863 RepID=UPI00293E1F6C|nr:uncharacterized protein LOC132614801 [Lycium barbarum]
MQISITMNTQWISPSHIYFPQTLRPTTKIQPFSSKPNSTTHISQKIESLPFHVNSITSTSNPFIKHCLKLRQSSSYRHSHASVLVVGSTPIREIYSFQERVQERPITLDCLLVLDEAHIPEDLNLQLVRLVRISSAVMKKLSGLQSIDSIEMIALMKIPSTFHSVDDEFLEEDCIRWFQNAHRVLVLDGIQDPGNLGTLLRSAMAFGWGGAFLLPGCCDPFNDKALRASRGASFQLTLVSGGWPHLHTLRNHFNMKMLAGHPANDESPGRISGLTRDFADSLADKNLCLVLGSEGGGLSEKSKDASELVSIPMAGEFESLNVSVAGGIFLYMLQPENHKSLSSA